MNQYEYNLQLLNADGKFEPRTLKATAIIATRGAAQTFASGWTSVVWDAEVEDVASEYTAGASFVLPAGIYLVSATIHLDAFQTEDGEDYQLRLYDGSAAVVASQLQPHIAAGDPVTLHLAAVVKLAADTYTLDVFNGNAANDVRCIADDSLNYIGIIRLL